MPPKGHALLSASSSDRWLHCPPSARLCELYEDKGSDYAAEGTDAHTLCEDKLRKALGMEATDPTENLTWFNQEMDDCATGYAAYILELVEAAKETCADPVVLIEQRVDFSRWVEEGFGTSDAILIADGTMHVIDYKHGLGILVSAVENPQLKCYALGALELFDGIYDIDNVCVHIVQPRRQNISTFEIAKDDLYRWADEVLKPTAELAFAGDGNFLCGEWCGFCKAKNECRARAEANLELARYDFKLPMVQQCIYENAHIALDQTEYQKRYDGLTERFEKAKARLDAVTAEIHQMQTQRASIEDFLKAFAAMPDELTEFTLESWHGLVDYGTVYAVDDIRFTFKNGQEVKA